MISTHLPDRAQKINNLSKYACVKKVDPFKIIMKLSSQCSWKMAATISMALEITLQLNQTIKIVLTKLNPFLMCFLVYQLLIENNKFLCQYSEYNKGKVIYVAYQPKDHDEQLERKIKVKKKKKQGNTQQDASALLNNLQFTNNMTCSLPTRDLSAL